MKKNITVSECKVLWDSYRRKQRKAEAMFKIKPCAYRMSLDAQKIGSVALAMKICKHKHHPYVHTQFPKKCTIEHCPYVNKED